MSNGPTFEAEPGWNSKIGTWLNRNKLWAIPTVVVVVLIIIFATRSGSKPETLLTLASPTTSNISAVILSETIIKGDSYTSVARRLLAKGTLTSSLMGSPGLSLYAETILQAELKTQPLIVGQQISMQAPRVHEILGEYANLYPSQRAKWEAMAKNVKF